MTPALSITGLTMRYDDGFLALAGFDLRTTASKIEVFGIDHAQLETRRLVILDEPTAGVDVELRIELWRYIRRLHEEGTTILLTTHYLEEADELCEEIALIRDGRLLARDSADGLRDSYDADSLSDVSVKAMAA